MAMTDMTTSTRESSALVRLVGMAQAAYFIIGGVWAVLHRRSFEAVTGPKVDYWLVRTVGSLLTVTGAAIALASRRERIGPDLPLLAIGSAATLATIDGVYTARRRISPIYLLDLLGNVALIAGWVVALRRR